MFQIIINHNITEDTEQKEDDTLKLDIEDNTRETSVNNAQNVRTVIEIS